MAERSFVNIEIDPEFRIHTSYHEDFFLLRMRVQVDGEVTSISSIKEGSYEGSGLSFYRATNTKLWKIANTISPVLHRYGVYHVDTFSYGQSPLFHVVFSSESCVQKFLLARDEIKSALESQLKSLFCHNLKNVKADIPETKSPECLSVEVQLDLFLVSPNRQKTSGAQVQLVTMANCSTLVTRWKNSRLFDFESLYQEGAEPPRITTQPKEFKDVIPGKSVMFTIQATGTEPLSYQWQWRPAGRGKKRGEWQSILCDGSTFQEVEGGLKLSQVMVCNAGYYRCIVCNCAGSETSQSAKLTVVMAESSPVGLAWLDALEGEFDRVFRELHLGLGALPPVCEEEAANLGGRVGAMASVFSQLVCKTKAVFQTNCKLEALLDSAHSELVKAKAEGGSLARELRGRTLQVRSLEVQQKQRFSEQDDTARELGILRAQLELEVEQYSQGEHCQENLEARVSHLEEENSALHQYVHSLHTDLAASSLAATYLQKELAGRMQQLQLLVKGIRGPSLKKLWEEINTEISLQRNKSLLAAYHSRDKVVDRIFDVIDDNLPSESQELHQKVMECSTHDQDIPTGRQVREVTIAKGENCALGMSVTGGREHGTPILIANMEKGMPAYESRKLQIGDAILSVNGQSLIGRTHDDAVVMLKSGSSEVTLEVAYVVGTTATPEGGSSPAEEGETDSSRPPTVAGLSKSTSLDLKAILGSTTSQSASHSQNSPLLANETISRPVSAANIESDAVSDYKRLASSFGFHLSPTPGQSISGAFADIGLFRYDEVEDSPVSTPIDESSHTPHGTHRRLLGANDGRELDQLKDASTSFSTLSSSLKQEHTTREVTDALLDSCSANDQQTAYTPSSMTLPQLSPQSPQHATKPPSDPFYKETATKGKYFAPQKELTPSVQSTHYVKLAAFNVQDVSIEEEDLPLFCGSIDV